MEMGKEIRRLRNARGLTQEALAAAMHVSAQTVSKWECGNCVPDVQLLPELAVFFGVTIDRLFAMTPEQQMERIENRVEDGGLIGEAEQRQLEQQLGAFAEDKKLAGQAELVMTKLYNHQAEQYRLLATEHGKRAVEKTGGSSDAVSELANAWGSYIPDWNVRNHHDLIAWYGDFCRMNPENRSALMWLLDNLIDDRRLGEARQWLTKLEAIDDSFRVTMYRYLIAQAAGERERCETEIKNLEAMAEREWCCALTLGDVYTQRQAYETAIGWYRKGQALQPAPKFVDSAVSIAHICEIVGDRTGAIEAYREALRLMKEDWGMISGAEVEGVERAIQKLQS